VLTPGTWALRARAADRSAGAFAEFTSATLVERYGLPDTLQIVGRARDLGDFVTPGSGCTFADESGGRRFNGLLTQIVRKGDGTGVLTWAGDDLRLWDRIVYPDPAHAITAQTLDYDVRTGPAESVLLNYIKFNAGPSALAARRVAGLTVPASAGRGATITTTARLDVLGRLITDIAEAAGLRVRVVQDGTDLDVVVSVVPDLTATARYGSADAGGPGLLADDWSYTLNRPTTNDAIVAGGGEGAARLFVEQADSGAQALWAARIESMVDQRQTSDTGELTQAGVDELAGGAAPVEITATVLDSPDLRIGVDVPLGALVSLDLAGELVVDRLRQITTEITVASGSPTVKITPLIGSLDAALTRDQKQFLAMKRALRKVASQ
jgi:hypothetical protein